MTTGSGSAVGSARPGECEDHVSVVAIEPERTGDCLDDLPTDTDLAGLLEPGVPSDAQAGELRELLTSEAWRAATRTARQINRRRIRGFTPLSKEVGELLLLNHVRHCVRSGRPGTGAIYTSIIAICTSLVFTNTMMRMTTASTASNHGPASAPQGEHWLAPVILLAVGTFAIGTDSFVLAGILPQLSPGLRVTEGAAGQVVTAFAITYATTAPFLSVLTHRVPRKTLIAFGLTLFVLMNVAGAFAPTLGVLIVTRVVCALGAASFTPTANAVSTVLAGPAARGRALSITLGGIALGTVFGVPVGTTIGQHLGWQASLLFVAAVGLVALVALVIVLPHLAGDAVIPMRQRFAVMGDRRVVLVVAITALATGSGILVHTYIAPIVHATAGISGALLALGLLVWGIGGAVGAFGCGWVIDRLGAGRTSALGIAILAAALVVIAFSSSATVTLVVMFFGGVGSWAFAAPNNHMVTGLHRRWRASSSRSTPPAPMWGRRSARASVGCLWARVLAQRRPHSLAQPASS
jgi:predicted MFS family arabinose efflux permease